MVFYRFQMQHNADSLVALSRMQYELFCTKNQISRTLLAGAAVIFGLSNYNAWWGLLIIAYGCYLISSTYVSSDRAAHKISQQIEASNMGYPCSEYLFEETKMRIFSLPDKEELDPLPYSKVLSLGEDFENFYLFRDRYGGYMLPKKQLGDREAEFRKFIEAKVGMPILSKRSKYRKMLMSKMKR